MNELEMFGRLALASVCAGAIGWERETAQKSAGIRTHTLVGVGAAVFTIVSIVGFDGADQARVAAQIVTGIGFLGAGAIFREGAFVRGLTTAAGLWVVAALGLAAGAGEITLTLIGTGTALVVLLGLRVADEAVARRKRVARDHIEITIDDTTKLEAILKFVRRLDADAEQHAFKRTGEKTGVLTLLVQGDHAEVLAGMLPSHKGVASAEVLSPLYWPQKRQD